MLHWATSKRANSFYTNKFILSLGVFQFVFIALFTQMLIERVLFAFSFRLSICFLDFADFAYFSFCEVFYFLLLLIRSFCCLYYLSVLETNLRWCIVPKFGWKGFPQNANNINKVCIRVRCTNSFKWHTDMNATERKILFLSRWLSLKQAYASYIVVSSLENSLYIWIYQQKNEARI